MTSKIKKERFHIILIRPSKYDDDGYVIRWWRGVMTSNSLACLHALTLDAFEKKGCLPGVEPIVHVLDETVQKIPVEKLCRQIHKVGEKAIVCMVGVQTNQFARAFDLSLEFKKRGFPVMIGGFHVSGILEMIPSLTPEIRDALDAGITLVAGEVEVRFTELLEAAYKGTLKPSYNFVHERPSLQGVPGPILPNQAFKRFFNAQTSFDAGRGCPFKCSFCTIINIQGNTMRGRTEDDIEKLIRHNFERGHRKIFITDDNFARHKDWEKIADRIIQLKEKENIRCSIVIQTDTNAHKIPRFIEKMTRAGVRRVFIGIESVNPENLKAAGKYQNQLKEYRITLQAWRDHGAITAAGYIIGFPADTYESIMRDIQFLKEELPLDLAEFFILTPLPGSKDHQENYLNKIPMATDTNLYDSSHVTMKHPNMSDEELMRAFQDSWNSFYSKEHCKTLLLRRKGPRRRLLFATLVWFCSTIFILNTHPLLGGFVRIKDRKTRRKGFSKEFFILFYIKRIWEFFSYVVGFGKLALDLWMFKRKADQPESQSYMDVAITPEPSQSEGNT